MTVALTLVNGASAPPPGAPGDQATGQRAASACPMPPGVWRAGEWAKGAGRVRPSGHARLDAELPGGGWPQGALIELLTATPRVPIWPLLLPALGACLRARGTVLALIDPPFVPFAPALAAQGLAPGQLLWLRGGAAPARLWLAEQALRCADVAAVLAWLPQARSGPLRRLHLAAAQRGDGLLFALRPSQAACEASPAALRLRLDVPCGPGAAAGAPLRVDIVKRRGPTLAQPLQLASRTAPVGALLAACGVVQAHAPVVAPATGERDAVDRLAVAA